MILPVQRQAVPSSSDDSPHPSLNGFSPGRSPKEKPLKNRELGQILMALKALH